MTDPTLDLQPEDYQRTAVTIWRLRRKLQQARMEEDEAEDVHKKKRKAREEIEAQLFEACDPPQTLPMEQMWKNGREERPARAPDPPPELPLQSWTETRLTDKAIGISMRHASILTKVGVITVGDCQAFHPGVSLARALSQWGGLTEDAADKAAAKIGAYIAEHGPVPQEEAHA